MPVPPSGYARGVGPMGVRDPAGRLVNPPVLALGGGAAFPGGQLGFAPIVGPVVSGARGLVTAGGAVVGVGKSLVSRFLGSPAGKAVTTVARDPRAQATAIGGGFLAGTLATGGGGGGIMGGMIPDQMVAYTWDTGTARFHRLIDGRIAVQRRNGTWKVYRPQKHIVVPRNPRIGTLLRADRRVGNLLLGMERRAARRRPRAKTRKGPSAHAGVSMIKQ